MTTNAPRAVFVTRETDYELLLARHATREQARFYLESRGQKLAEVEARHERFVHVLRHARMAVPAEWRQTLVRRTDFDRFLFGPEDVVVAVGQDGLVANVAKYLDSQLVLGINPDPDLYDGVLARIVPERFATLLPACINKDVVLEHRTMVEARLENGESILALNEVFVGHRGHQSARYGIAIDSVDEDHSSSGLIIATGTGASGWARSIMEATGVHLSLAPEEKAVAYFVREPFPTVVTGTTLRAGKLFDGGLTITSRMNEGGTIFADGMEQDRIVFDWGRRLTVTPSARTLNLVAA